MDEICCICGWQDDPLQREYPDETGANGKLTFNEAQRMIANGEKPFAGFPKEDENYYDTDDEELSKPV
jgi:hypothetical protein